MTTTRPNRTHERKRACAFPDCGRPVYAGGYCQTHHRQSLTTGELKPIRPYRPRQRGTVKFGGLRLSPSCVERLQRKARRRGTSYGAAIAEVLEAWNRGGARRARR